MRWSLVGLLVGACFSPSPPAGSPCPTGNCPSGLVCSPVTMTCETMIVDARPDVPIDAVAGCYGNVVPVCPDDPITGQDNIVIATTTTIDTTSSMLCEPYHLPNGTIDKAYCLITAKTITVTSTGRIAVTGARPLVVLGTNTIDLQGVLDVASHRGGQLGAGSNDPSCVTGVTTTTQGGPGGSFGSKGGDGGGVGGGQKALAGPPATTIVGLRGGCPGTRGDGLVGGAPGRGGGAVALITETLRIGGTINASGAAGAGAGLSSGGGGGGAGGMIVLDAPTITVVSAGQVFANGGGGGEGGGGGNPGTAGTDPTSPTSAGQGGAGGASGGGNGGDGATGTMDARDGNNESESGGGGGGGVGVIRVFPSQVLGGSISPPPT